MPSIRVRLFQPCVLVVGPSLLNALFVTAEGQLVYGDRFRQDRIDIINALGAYYIRKLMSRVSRVAREFETTRVVLSELGITQKDPKQRDACFAAAIEKLNQSAKLNEGYAYTWVAKGTRTAVFISCNRNRAFDPACLFVRYSVDGSPADLRRCHGRSRNVRNCA